MDLQQQERDDAFKARFDNLKVGDRVRWLGKNRKVLLIDRTTGFVGMDGRDGLTHAAAMHRAHWSNIEATSGENPGHLRLVNETQYEVDIVMRSDGETQVLRPGSSVVLVLHQGDHSDPIVFSAAKEHKTS